MKKEMVKHLGPTTNNNNSNNQDLSFLTKMSYSKYYYLHPSYYEFQHQVSPQNRYHLA